MNAVAILGLIEERNRERTAKLREIQQRFLSHLNSPTVGEFATKVQSKTNAALLSAYADAVRDLDTTSGARFL